MTRVVNWSVLFEDLVYLGMSGSLLAARLTVDVPYLRRLAGGQRPSTEVGERVIDLWCRLTMKGREFVPTQAGPQRLMGEPVPYLAHDDSDAPTYQQLQKVASDWASLTARSLRRRP